MESGIKVALPGFDARTAPDYDLSFSSNWPMLQVVKTFTHTVTSAELTTVDTSLPTSTSSLTFTHNLKYYAFADVWEYGQFPILPGQSVTNFSETGTRRMNSLNGYTLYFGKNTIKVPLAFSPGTVGDANTLYYATAGTVINVKVYSFDFTKPFSYAAILPPVGASQYDPHLGIKTVRNGRSIDSVDLRDFIIHSKGSAPQLLTVQTPVNANVTYTTSGSTIQEKVTYQIPNRIPARIDFLYSTDATSWEAGTGSPTWAAQVLESSTGLAYYATVYGQYDIQSVGNVSYTMSNTGLFTSLGLYKPVAFSVIVRRDPLLYSAPTEIMM